MSRVLFCFSGGHSRDKLVRLYGSMPSSTMSVSRYLMLMLRSGDLQHLSQCV